VAIVAGVASVTAVFGACLPSAEAAQRVPALSARSWAQIASFVGLTNVWGLTCPSATTCEVVGAFSEAGVVMRTTNGGASWSDQPVPPGVGELRVISCRSTSVCVAAGEYTPVDGVYGEVALHTTNGGATWVAKKFPAGIGQFSAISCPTASVCEAFAANATGSGGEATRTTDGGTTWVNKAIPGVSQTLAISCPSPTTCEGVGLNNRDYAMTLRTTNGGKTWATKTLPDKEAQYLGSVACQSAKVCEAAGTIQAAPLVLRTINGGASWKPETVPAGLSDGDVASLSCPSAPVCTAIDPNGFMRTTDSGTKWSQEPLIAGVSVPTILSCPSASTCVAASTASQGPLTLHTTDAGTRWAIGAFPTGLAQLDAITCRSTSVCEGGGVGGSVRTTDRGASWVEQTTGGYSDYGFDDIACSSYSVCEAGLGTDSTVLHTTNGGATWVASLTFPPSLGRAPFSGLACPTASFCLGVMDTGSGSDVLRTTDSGKVWVNVGSPLAAKEGLSGLSCPSASVCVAVGEAYSTNGGAVAIRTTDGGLKWAGGAKFPSNIAQLSGVSCPTTSTCEAVGESFTYSSGYTVRGVSPLATCPGTSTCRMESGDIPAYPYALRTTDGGTRWVGTKLPAGVGLLDAIACPTPSVCEAVGSHAAPSSAAARASAPAVAAVGSVDGGTAWATQPLPAGIAALKSVACPSPYDCYAAGYSAAGALVVRLS
jgi:photosystem II stability/assembly factor-like uncharacterized protein